jgi:hypothetical protein
MKTIEDNIAIFIKNQFPEFYREQGDNFIEFVTEYYRWSQQTNNDIYFSRNLLEFRDIDTTIDRFLVHFKEKYVAAGPLVNDKVKSNIKHSLDFYRSKGTEQGTKLLFKELYNESDVQTYFPGSDVIRTSDGEWSVPTYLEVSVSPKNATFVGKIITGSSSGATAFVESSSRRSIGGKFFDLLIISDVDGRFQYLENITSDNNLTDAPKIIGSLSSIVIDSPGKDFFEGDIVDIISEGRGTLGKARVNTIGQSTGKISFQLLYGGTCYGSNTVEITADKTVGIENIANTQTEITYFIPDEVVTQPMAALTFNAANVQFELGANIVGSNSTANVATGTIVGVNQQEISGVLSVNAVANATLVTGRGTKFTSELVVNNYIKFSASNTFFRVVTITSNSQLVIDSAAPNLVANTVVIANGSIQVMVNSGNFVNATLIGGTSATIFNVTDRTANGTVLGGNSIVLGIQNTSGTFTANLGNYIVGSASGITANLYFVGVGQNAAYKLGAFKAVDTIVINTDKIKDYRAVNLNALSFGLPNDPEANISSTIGSTLNYENYNIGTVISIGGINPGGGYNFKPFTVFKDPYTTRYEIRDQYIRLNKLTSSTFIPGEFITQVTTKPSADLTVKGSVIPPQDNDIINQINGGTIAYGRVVTGNTSFFRILTNNTFVNSTLSSAITGTASANSTSANVVGVGTTFSSDLSSGSFIKFSGSDFIFRVNSVTNNTLLTLTSNAVGITSNTVFKANGVAVIKPANLYFFVNNAVVNTIQYTANSEVLSVVDTLTEKSLVARPTALSAVIEKDLVIVGGTTNAAANVIFVDNVPSTPLVGYNAVVNTFAEIANGIIKSVSVTDSGFAYEDDELITIVSPTGASATGFVRLNKQGVGSGYFKSTRGFLNSDKYIHDGDFYQTYSYQIKSSLPLEDYADTLKQIAHVAGTKLFGSVVRTSTANVRINTDGVLIET